MSVQNSYSYELANIFVGGRDEQDMLEKYQAILDMLPIKLRLFDVSRGFCSNSLISLQDQN